MVWALILLARSALGRGELVRAGRLWGAADAENEESRILANDDDVHRITAPLRSVTKAEFAEGMTSGKSLSLADAASDVLSPQTEP